MWSYILSVIHSSWVYMKTMYTTSIQFGSRKTDIRFFLVKRKTLCLCYLSTLSPLSINIYLVILLLYWLVLLNSPQPVHLQLISLSCDTVKLWFVSGTPAGTTAFSTSLKLFGCRGVDGHDPMTCVTFAK